MMALTAGLAAADTPRLDEVRSIVSAFPLQILFAVSGEEQANAALADDGKVKADILVLDATLPGILQRAGDLASAPHRPDVILLIGSDSADQLLRALRAGATDAAAPPWWNTLGPVLHLAIRRRRIIIDPGPPGTLIGFVSAKGGCGASSVVLHVAAELCSNGSNLVIDLDREAPQLAFLLRLSSEVSIANAVSGGTAPAGRDWDSLTLRTPVSSLELLAGMPIPATGPLDPDAVRAVLNSARRQYRCTCVDFGRGLGDFNANLIPDVDELVLITTSDLGALFMARTIIRWWAARDSHRTLSLVLNRVPEHPAIGVADIEKALDFRVAAVLPEAGPEMERAVGCGNLVPEKSSLGRKYRELARGLAARHQL